MSKYSFYVHPLFQNLKFSFDLSNISTDDESPIISISTRHPIGSFETLTIKVVSFMNSKSYFTSSLSSEISASCGTKINALLQKSFHVKLSFYGFLD